MRGQLRNVTSLKRKLGPMTVREHTITQHNKEQRKRVTIDDNEPCDETTYIIHYKRATCEIGRKGNTSTETEVR